MTLQDWINKTKTNYSAVGRAIDERPQTVQRHARGERIPNRKTMLRYFLLTGGKVDANAFYGLTVERPKGRAA